MIEGGLVSLTAVKLTPDLLEARIYLSMFQVKDVPAVMKKIEERGWEIKRELAARVKRQLRRIPTLEYFYDDSLEHADKMGALFRKINEDRMRGEGLGEDRTLGKESRDERTSGKELGDDRTRGEEGSHDPGEGKPRGEGGAA